MRQMISILMAGSLLACGDKDAEDTAVVAEETEETTEAEDSAEEELEESSEESEEQQWQLTIY